MNQSGAKFGKYTLVRKLSSGEGAVVYLAKQPGVQGFSREVVIKCVAQSQVERFDAVARFLDEAKLVARMSHPNIVAVHEFGQVDDTPYMMMEYVEGVTLAELIDASMGIEPAQSLRIASELCAGLTYAHSLLDGSGSPIGIVHRDVSPENVLIGADGSVKLTDFGLAKASTTTRETASEYGEERFAHISPEQARDEKIDHRADVHGVGVLLWESLTGERLFQRSIVLETIEAVATVAPHSVLRRYPDISPKLDEIIAKATAKTPDERYESCAELQDAIDEYASEEGLLSSSLALRRYLASFYGASDEVDPPKRGSVGSGQIVIEPIELPELEDMTIPDTSLAESMSELAPSAAQAIAAVSSSAPDRGDATIPTPPPFLEEEDEEYDAFDEMETNPMQRVYPSASQPPAAPIQSEAPSPSSPPPQEERSRFFLWVLLFVIGVGGVAGVTYFVLRNDMERMVRDGPIAASIVEGDRTKHARESAQRQVASTADGNSSPSDATSGDLGDVDGAFLTIVSDPPGAQLFIDGNETGEWTAVGDFPLDTGEHEVELRLRGYRRWRRRITAEQGEREVLRARLRRLSADELDADVLDGSM